MDENVTVIVPAYNEAENITSTISALKNIQGISEILAVNDGSTDDTLSVLQQIDGIQIIDIKLNHGKGYAIKSALPYVTNSYVMLVDADLRESAIEMKNLVSWKQRNSRVLLVAVYPKPLKKGGFGLVKKLCRKSLIMLTSKSSDSVLSGQRLVYTDFLRQIDLPDNFGIEFKITLEALRKDVEIIDIPLNIRHRETGRDLDGFLHRGKQFSNILKVVIRELIS